MDVVIGKKFWDAYEDYRHQPWLQKRIDACIELFRNNPRDRRLRNHKLSGMPKRQEVQSFCVTDDIRVLCQHEKDRAILFALGPHKKVYRGI